MTKLEGDGGVTKLEGEGGVTKLEGEGGVLVDGGTGDAAAVGLGASAGPSAARRLVGSFKRLRAARFASYSRPREEDHMRAPCNQSGSSGPTHPAVSRRSTASVASLLRSPATMSAVGGAAAAVLLLLLLLPSPAVGVEACTASHSRACHSR